MAPKKRKADELHGSDANEPPAAASLSVPSSVLPSSTIRETILQILGNRKTGATCCPSEVPRRLFPSAWRNWMEATRQEAFKLADEGLIEITQKGNAIDHRLPIQGPIRLRRKVPSQDPP